MQLVLTPELLIEAYKQGLFPMAYRADSPYIHWLRPDMRGQLSIEELHIPRRLRDTLKSGLFEIKINTAFGEVVKACAVPTPKRPETWINQAIFDVFLALHYHGHAHSVECWRGHELVGGVYGLAIGQAFFGESMFSRTRDASKVALVHMAARLWTGGFKMLDTQFTNPHLKQFGVYEIPNREYLKFLHGLISMPADFKLPGIAEDKILRDYLAFREKS